MSSIRRLRSCRRNSASPVKICCAPVCARAEIISERDRAIAVLRRETVDLAVRAASKVIERNLDVEANRAVVESFLASIAPAEAKH